MNSEIFSVWRRLTSKVTCQQEEVSIFSVASILSFKFNEVRAVENLLDDNFSIRCSY